MAPEPGQPQNLATAVTEVSERASLLIREEIELAKAEITEKVTRLIKGAAIGLAAGIFVVTALMFFLHGLAWLAWFELFAKDSNANFFWGFIIVGAGLLLLGGLAGYLAAKAVKAGAPPTPDMAIEEAKRIRDTVTSSAEGAH